MSRIVGNIACLIGCVACLVLSYFVATKGFDKKAMIALAVCVIFSGLSTILSPSTNMITTPPATTTTPPAKKTKKI